jgi:serine/threonine protein kinase
MSCFSNTLADRFPGRLDWNQRYHILKGTCQGLRYLHQEKCIIHGDIKPDNILLDDNLVPKLFDFGFSKPSRSEVEFSTVTDGVTGTM